MSLPFDRQKLWFGDERGYNATHRYRKHTASGCGLVMKEDITQQEQEVEPDPVRCGLVMKEDITQQILMREDSSYVVVW